MALDKSTVNPTRNKKMAIEVACLRYSTNALEILVNALDEKKTPNLEYRYRLDAAKEILNRALGKPKQQVDMSVDLSVKGYSDALTEARKRLEETTVIERVVEIVVKEDEQ